MTRGRRTLGLRPPREPLTGFPTWRLRRHQALCRAHRAGRSPWWFAASTPGRETGRFDLPEPDGACYVTIGREAALAALRERAGPSLVALGWLSGRWCDETAVSTLDAPFGGQLADTTHLRAVLFGVTREISTTTRYDLTQRWSTALHRLGVRGLRYEPRFSSDGAAYSLAIFGSSGPAAYPVDPAPRSGRDIADSAGILVADPPPSGRLTYRTPPARR